jgi:UDPglucose 6-dehydrogenase|tara:strand:+ start:39570 stop:40361 length:792 start_codon:yes stop_codon:yes gene_type:complete
MLKLGIIGKGFVGSAVSNGFDKDCEQFIVDPTYTDNTIMDLIDQDTKLIFVCVPTPPNDDGSINVDTVVEVLSELSDLSYKGVVVVKSTIIPDYLHHFKKVFDLKIVYNPEFLTEANSLDDFINPNMQVLGGKWRDCEVVEKAYLRHSSVKIVPTFKTDLTTASLLKYTINSYLATKVMFFNDLHKLHESGSSMVSWEQFTDMLTRDPRIGNSHMQVPGPDGELGFGGHCFPKDTEALLKYAQDKKINLNMLKKAVETNKKIR